ncbi:TOG array regulator of axonemal microtubules protein 2 isoform X2 [Struthio camelus]|uniref:TOG array regulator of axonemal microtubules protein 2 isoform X2 n=1 Tax=Struthio camelus TaxID=8801 RepID=UPI003603F60B
MATHDDFAAGQLYAPYFKAKYRVPVAVYCGSVPEVKPRCRALRGGSIDSNLQLCGSRWTTAEEASLQPLLSTQVKEQPGLWGRDRRPLYPRAMSPLEVRDGKTSLENLDTGARGDLLQLPSPALKQDPGEREVSSAAMETAQIKDKLKKRRMSEGLLVPQRGLLDSGDPAGLALKPAVSRSASQRLLVTSKPMPPIQHGPPSPETGEASNGEPKDWENGIDGGDSDESHEGLTSEACLQPCRCSEEEEAARKLQGAAVVPPIATSASMLDGGTGRAVGPPPGSPVSQEPLEVRSRSGSRTQEKTLKPLGLSLSRATGMDHLASPRLLSDDEWKESNGRIHITISKSAQEKMRQKQMREMELLRREREKEREKEKSLQLHVQSADPVGADEEGFGPLNVNGLVSLSPSMSNAGRTGVGTALKKRINRPSLPNIPAISQEGSFSRHASDSLPAIALGCPEWGEEPECGDASAARPFSHPEQGLGDALGWLGSSDWQLKGKGLFSIRRLAICHSEILLCRLHDVSLAVTKEVNNLRSKVCRFAIGTLGELFRTMKKHMDQEVEEIARALLQKAGDSSEFIQKAAYRSLGIMVGSVTPARAMAALMAGGVNHRNALVRRCAAEHLLTVTEQIGAEKLLSGSRESTELLVQALVKLAQDCNQDTRFYGRKMLNMLMNHPKFDGYLKQSLPSHDLRDVMATIKQKGVEDHISEPPSAKGRRESRKSSLTTSLDILPSDEGSSSDVLVLPHQTVRRISLRTVEEIEQLKELNKLLTAKEFQTRMEGVVLLLDHCKNNPQLISANIVQIFDIFVLRLQDSNKKVNQQALESLAAMMPLLGDGLHPVLVPVVAAVTDNLNSKNAGIYAAAVKVLDASIAHLDNVLLLQVFANRVRFLSGRAVQDVTDRLSVLVASVSRRKRQAVERYVLPVLWHFLGSMIGNGVLPGRGGNIRSAVARLAGSLYAEMGASLAERAAGQPPHVAKNLRDVLELDLR